MIICNDFHNSPLKGFQLKFLKLFYRELKKRKQFKGQMWFEADDVKTRITVAVYQAELEPGETVMGAEHHIEFDNRMLVGFRAGVEELVRHEVRGTLLKLAFAEFE